MRRRSPPDSDTSPIMHQAEATPLLVKPALGPSPPESVTIRYDELSDWRKDNPSIHSLYRREMPSYKDCAWSIVGYLHNETTNIWTHLVGAVVALVALYVTFFVLRPSAWYLDAGRQGWLAPFSLVWPFPSEAQPSVTVVDAIGFGVFFVSAAVCLGFSATFHTLHCHSPHVAAAWNRADYVGICVLISGTFFPAVHYGFFCDPHLRTFYISLIYFLSALVVGTLMSPKARTPEFRKIRTYLFILLGLSAVFPVAHGIVRYGLRDASDAISLFWLALGGGLYIVGAMFYAERFPEKWKPGRFDAWGGSHTIFHVFILLAAWAHYTALVESFRFWHHEQGGECVVRGVARLIERDEMARCVQDALQPSLA